MLLESSHHLQPWDKLPIFHRHESNEMLNSKLFVVALSNGQEFTLITCIFQSNPKFI